MATVASLQNRIRTIDGINSRIHHYNGRDVRDDRGDIPFYPFRKAAPGAWSVARWKKSRFAPNYPSFKVEVLDDSGKPVNGKSLLKNVRAGY